MKTITIIFMGLIAHVNQPGLSLDDTAVLLRREGHTPRFEVGAGAILNPDDPWVKAKCGNADPCVIDLTGYAVRLEDIRGMFCNKRPVATAVPKLQTIAPNCSGLRQEVRDRKVTEQFAAFVDYGAGELTVRSYFQEMVGFYGKSGRFNCAACSVRYRGELAGDQAVFVFKDENGETHTLRIAADSEVTISNNPLHDHVKQRREPGDSDFVAHYALLTNCKGPAPLVEGTCVRPEEDEYCGLPTIPLADCTNSQFP